MNIRSIISTVILFFGIMGASASNISQTDTVTIPTKNLREPGKAIVILPEQACQPNNTTRFPTVYLLHGYSDNYTSIAKEIPALQDYANRMGLIFVMPDGRNLWYWDSISPKGQNMESFITNDLIPYIDTKYPTLAQRSSRAISGISMGGHGALWIGLRHPDLFKAAGSMSGGVDIRPFADQWEMKELLGTIEDNPKAWDEHTVMTLADTISPGQIDIIFDAGTEDFVNQVNADLHKKLVERKIPHEYISRPGEHSWDYWRNSIKYQLLFFNDRLHRTLDR